VTLSHIDPPGRARRAARGAVLLACAALAAPASALQIDNGDIVGVFSKNGFEVVVNLGTGTPGTGVDLSGVVPIPQFNPGGMVGVKFVALAVDDPGRMITCCGGFTVPLENIEYSTLVADPMPADTEIALAMGRVDHVSASAVVWFQLLRQHSGVDSEILASTDLDSYELVLGHGTDAIDNWFQFSTAGILDAQQQLEIGFHSSVRGYADQGGPDSEHEHLLNIVVDGDQVDFEPAPEPSAAIGTVVGALALAACSRRRRRATR
jgi:hypothetical protein